MQSFECHVCIPVVGRPRWISVLRSSHAPSNSTRAVASWVALSPHTCKVNLGGYIFWSCMSSNSWGRLSQKYTSLAKIWWSKKDHNVAVTHNIKPDNSYTGDSKVHILHKCIPATMHWKLDKTTSFPIDSLSILQPPGRTLSNLIVIAGSAPLVGIWNFILFFTVRS